MRWIIAICLALVGGFSALADTDPPDDTDVEELFSTEALTGIKPSPRDDWIPRARWDFHPKGHLWTRATMAALDGHGQPLVQAIPHDIANWCPAYANNDDKKRAAFWNGFLSALAKHESTWRPRAVGGGGRWFGLMQILPGTARGYGCRVGTGRELQNGAANLSCAVRIMSETVTRDNAVARKADGSLGGVAADWGPLTKRAKREEMAAWTRKQTYCKLLSSVRPAKRP